MLAEVSSAEYTLNTDMEGAGCCNIANPFLCLSTTFWTALLLVPFLKQNHFNYLTPKYMQYVCFTFKIKTKEKTLYVVARLVTDVSITLWKP